MKKTSSLIIVTLFLTVWLAPSGAAQFGRERDRVCFYRDVHYQGAEQCYVPGDEVADLRNQRNSFSSIRMFGRARVVVYDDREFRGDSEEFFSDVPDLGLRNMNGSRSWSDHIDSFRIAGNFGGSFPGGNRGRDNGDRRDDRVDWRDGGRDGVCVYEHANFRGRSECFGIGDDIRDLARVRGWNDQISSIRIIGAARVLVYSDGGYRGERLVVDRNIADLAVIRFHDRLSWNDQISSLEVQLDRNGRGRGRGRW